MKKLVSASLAGALAVGMVPAMAFAVEGDQELETLAVTDAFAKGAINGVTTTQEKPYEYTYNGEAQYVVPTTVVLGNGDTVDVTDPAKFMVSYSTADGSSINDKAGIKDAGSYVVKVKCVDSKSKYNEQEAVLYFDIEKASLAKAEAYLINDDDAADYSATSAVFDGETIEAAEFGFVIDGKKVDDDDITVTWVKKGSSTWKSGWVWTAGTYVATVTAKEDSNYVGYKQDEFVVEPFNLANASIVLPDVIGTWKAPAPSDLVINGKKDTGLVKYLNVEFSTNTNGDVVLASNPGIGGYTYTVANEYTAEENAALAASIINTADVTFSFAQAEGQIYYGTNLLGDPTAADVVTVDRSSATSEEFDLSKIKAVATVDGQQVALKTVVTAVDALGNSVDPAVTAPGEYTLTVRIDAADAANGYKWGGSETLAVSITEGAVDFDANTYVSYKGEVVGSITADYTGADVIDDISVVVKNAKGVVLTEGTDYKVEYFKGTKKVTEIVDAGTDYKAVITGLGTYKADNNTDTVNITVSPVAIHAIQAQDVRDNTIAYTGQAIVPVFEYCTEAQWDAGEAAAKEALKAETVTDEQIKDYVKWTVLPSEVYNVAYKYQAKATATAKSVAEVKAEGIYTAAVTLKATNIEAKAGNYTANSLSDDFLVSSSIGFKDVPANAWYAVAVNALADEEIMNGVGNSLFKPNQNTTRAMVAAVLSNVDGNTKVSTNGIGEIDFWQGIDTPFADVNEGAWYAPAVAWAAAAEVVNGWVEDGELVFAPEKDVTREQIACMIVNYMKAIGEYEAVDTAEVLATMPDGAKVSGYAKDSVAWMVANGYMGNGGVVNPKGTATRAELAGMIYNVFLA